MKKVLVLGKIQALIDKLKDEELEKIKELEDEIKKTKKLQLTNQSV